MEKHLTTEPKGHTSRKKELRGLVPPWEHEPPVWELRVGEYRVFYDVDEESRQVMVRAVRRKGAKTTEEIV
jgi:mRNA-degrading endonuclease RelE of RelBE toxin-antitoxin system